MRRSTRLLGWAAVGAAAFYGGRALLRQSRCYHFRGRTVLITGGSRGLGLVMARQLIREGARIAICARDEQELEAAREDLARHGEVLALRCDVTSREEVQRVVDEVTREFNGIDVLVNNAGVIQVSPIDEMTLDDYEQAMQVHYWGPLYMILAVLPQMRQRGEGRIVNIGSIGGKISVPHLLPYSASKFALVGLSEGLRTELLKDGIYVTTVCPGMMRTGSPMNAQFKGQHEAEFAWFTVSDSLPLLSLSAEAAAHQVIDACRHGEAEVVLSLPAKAAALVHGVAPGLTAEALGVVNRLLPGPGGIGAERASGWESRPKWLPSWLIALTEQAARENNEIPASQP